jgi:hypothetical protein
MNASTEFDLNAAIRTWRQNLSQSPQFRAENLDELEAHLRDAIATMQGQRLTDEEVFLVATRRLGGVHVLEPEFAKINAREVWLHRALWMLIGVQVWSVLSGLERVASELAAVGGLVGYGRDWIEAPGQAWLARVAVLSFVAQAATLVFGVWFCSWLIRRRERQLAVRAAQVLNRPALLGLAVAAGFVMLVAIQFFGWAESALFAVKLHAKQFGLLTASRMWGSLGLGLAQILALLVCTALLARRLFVKKLPTG